MNEAETTAATPRRTFEPHESFFAAQERNRRAAWRMTGLSVVAVALTGIPLTLVVTPLVCALGLLFADLVNHVFPLPTWFWSDARHLSTVAFRALGSVLNHTPTDRATIVSGTLVFILPGGAAAFAIWMLVLRAFRRAGAGSALLALKPRSPDASRLKELELNDILDEIAIAARMARPRAMILEAQSANAAAIGSSPHDASIIVTTGLLDLLNREELEAVIAHLMASVGGGDLPIAFLAESVFTTWAALLTVINAPFEREARTALMSLLAWARGPENSQSVDSGGAEDLRVALDRDMDSFDTGINRFFNDTGKNRPLLKRILWLPLFPIFITNFSIFLTVWLFSMVAVGPAIALLWRARRYLADSSTVQFTRDPDGLASALLKLDSERPAALGGAASHLFFVSCGSSGAGDGHTGAGLEARSFLSFHPSIRRRIERLHKMGAQVAAPAPPAGLNKVIIGLSLVLGPMLLLALVLALFLLAALVLFNLLLLALWLAAIFAVAG